MTPWQLILGSGVEAQAGRLVLQLFCRISAELCHQTVAAMAAPRWHMVHH